MRILYAGTMNLGVEKGDSLHFSQLAQALRRRGHKVTVFARGSQVNVDLDHLAVRLVPLFAFPRIGPIVNDALLTAVIMRQLVSRQFDILYQRGIPLVNRFARRLGTPSLVEVNGIRADEVRLHGTTKLQLRYFQYRERRIVEHASRVICVTAGIQDQLIRRYAVPLDRCTVIPNAADTRRFRPQLKQECQRRVGLDSDEYNVGFVGAFQHWVDFESLLHAVRVLSCENVPVRCVIVGDGSSYRTVADRIAEFSLGEMVRLVGRVPHREVPDWIGAFDVCIAPFMRVRNEIIGISPLKVFEYMACWRPVVASALPGITTVIESAQAGLLYPVEDAGMLAKQLLLLYRDPELGERFGRCGGEYALRHHSWDSVAERIEVIMYNLLSSGSI